MKSEKPKILVAMSGGVDSSVAAALLVKEGYDVTGAFMVNFDTNDYEATQGVSCWINDYRDVVRVAAKLGISLIKWDFKKEYHDHVVEYMFKEYSKGKTPNPDIMCNKYIKFGFWLKKAEEMGFDKLATGHYAKLKVKSKKKKEFVLQQAKDENKDQTYFLHQLNQEQLSKTLFPLGDYTKEEVRKLAKKFDLPTAQKEESMGICFIGEIPINEFLKTKIKPKLGKIIMTSGEVVGEHEGLAFYTIGQRHLSRKSKVESPKSEDNKKPLFVIDKKFDSNELVVGYEDDPLLYKKEIEVEDAHWISGLEPDFPLNCEVRLRHRQPLQKSKVTKSVKSKELIVEYKEPQKAVTPGQFAVFYKDGECLGGGVIK